MSMQDSIDRLQEDIRLHYAAGRILEAAESQRLLAERYESVNNQEAALEAYRQSATYFSRENRASSATKMQLKVAQCSALLKRYRDAIQIFEADAKQSLESHGSAAKMHLLNAGICALATNDLTLVHTKLHEYQGIVDTFADSREGALLQALVQSYESSDSERLADGVYAFDKATRIDPWHITILLRIKQRLTGEE